MLSKICLYNIFIFDIYDEQGSRLKSRGVRLPAESS